MFATADRKAFREHTVSQPPRSSRGGGEERRRREEEESGTTRQGTSRARREGGNGEGSPLHVSYDDDTYGETAASQCWDVIGGRAACRRPHFVCWNMFFFGAPAPLLTRRAKRRAESPSSEEGRREEERGGQRVGPHSVAPNSA